MLCVCPATLHGQKGYIPSGLTEAAVAGLLLLHRLPQAAAAQPY